MAKIKEFIEYLSAEEYTGLFREACEKGWENIKDQYGDLDVRETIQEVHLAQKERTCDYSINGKRSPYERILAGTGRYGLWKAAY